jgi:hypothetical protein
MQRDKSGNMNDGKKLIRNSTAEFLIFTGQAGEQSIEARYEDETIWLSQKLMAALFDVDVRTVNEHLKNVYEQREVTPEATIRKFRIVQTEGKREVARNVDFYNLDAIISVGYRVNSVRATQFRQWAPECSGSLPSRAMCWTMGRLQPKSPRILLKASSKNIASCKIGCSRAISIKLLDSLNLKTINRDHLQTTTLAANKLNFKII